MVVVVVASPPVEVAVLESVLVLVPVADSVPVLVVVTVVVVVVASVPVAGGVVGAVLVEVSPPQAVREATSARLAAVRPRFWIFNVIKLNRLLLCLILNCLRQYQITN